MTDDLCETIDASWRSLLKKFSAKSEDGSLMVPFDQQIEALVAAGKWYETRAKIVNAAPVEEKKEDKFSGIKRQFHREPKRKPPVNPWGRRGKPADAEAVSTAVAAQGFSDEAADIATINGSAELAAGDDDGDAAEQDA